MFSPEGQATKGLNLLAKDDEQALLDKHTRIGRPRRAARTAKMVS